MFEQDRVIVRLQQRVNQESEVRVCFLAGSYGRRQEDSYSDLDVALVFADAGSRDLAWPQRREFVRSVLPYVSVKSFDAGHVRPYLHIALYSNGSKVDYRYETMADLSPNYWDRDIRILKDNEGWGQQFQRASADALRIQPHLSEKELADLDNRFWVMFWDVYRLVLRGDHDKPFTIYLELLHFTLPALLRVLPPEDPSRRALLNAQFNDDSRAIARGMARLLAAYVAGRAAVIRRLNLDFTPDSTFETSIRRLVKRTQ